MRHHPRHRRIEPYRRCRFFYLSHWGMPAPMGHASLKYGAGMSRKSAERKFNHTADEHQRELVSLINKFSYGHHLDTVFRDFVEMAALAISNRVDRAQYDAREKRYMEIVGKYKPEEVQRFPAMFAALTGTFEVRVQGMINGDGIGLTDVLGETYMMLGISNDRSGQFFTPYAVSKLMAGMIGGDAAARADAQGFARVQEPACGAGGMVIATAEAFHDAGLNYQESMHATCVDIDPCCVHMAYVQLSLLHVPAIVVHGNTLSMQVWGQWYTPAHVLGGWNQKLRARRAWDAMRELMRGAPVDEQPDTLSVPPAPAMARHVCDPEPVVGDETINVDVLERPVELLDTDGLADMFEEAVGAQPRANDFFEIVDQLALF
ncbi:MAG TPA: N-6 DNA methylase [Paraburkholderia sp.]|uniref:N-6 DNA methylase n=1 Tax=Paraburkholderia sp. TaxID=1926495 RepID=UPI002B45EEB4|nr:N-6 DNA methylase [Paraburkholderia sp.]HKR46628.1 N-6 DNA methylase [Paraburkholderia sp.]